MKRLILSLVLAISLTACASSGQDQGQGAIDQNIRGGIFSSYTGQHGAGEAGLTNVTRTVTDKDGGVSQEIIQITSNAPFVMMFDSAQIEANTDGSTTGATNDTASATNSTDTDTPTSITPVK